MSNTTNLYDYASLSEVCYAHFDKLIADFSSPPGNVKELIIQVLSSGPDEYNCKYSLTQAEAFVEKWTIVNHTPNTPRGFSATLFRNNETGEFVYANRGTEPDQYIMDLTRTDIGDIVENSGGTILNCR